jgi:acetyl esterase/lipase
MHGGGYVMGDLETDHGWAAKVATTVGAVVVSVDYRLAPENPYPAALDDCHTALTGVVEEAVDLGIDPSRVAVMGTSAGGGLATALTIRLRDRGGPEVRFQHLGMPALDDRLATPSMTQFTDTPGWKRSNAQRSWTHYLGGPPGAPGVSMYAAPARAEDLSGLPAAYLYVCELDPLRDEGLVYAQRLVQAGVPTEVHLYPGTFHGSGLITGAAVSRRMNAESIAALSRALDGSAEGGESRLSRAVNTSVDKRRTLS